MELTKNEAVRLFREHWKWLAETGSNNKWQWLEDSGYQDIHSSCFLCEYGYSLKANCGGCPVIWEEIHVKGIEPCMRSYFGQWNEAQSPEERKRIAKIISELPEKEG